MIVIFNDESLSADYSVLSPLVIMDPKEGTVSWSVNNGKRRLFFALLPAPALLTTVGTLLNHFGNWPHDATLVHTEATHRLLVSREPIRVENTLLADEPRVTILCKIFGTCLPGPWPRCRRFHLQSLPRLIV